MGRDYGDVLWWSGCWWDLGVHQGVAGSQSLAVQCRVLHPATLPITFLPQMEVSGLIDENEIAPDQPLLWLTLSSANCASWHRRHKFFSCCLQGLIPAVMAEFIFIYSEDSSIGYY